MSLHEGTLWKKPCAYCKDTIAARIAAENYNRDEIWRARSLGSLAFLPSPDRAHGTYTRPLATADKMNDFNHVARVDGMHRMVGSGHYGTVELHRDGSRRQRQMLKQLPYVYSVRDVLFFPIYSDDHGEQRKATSCRALQQERALDPAPGSSRRWPAVRLIVAHKILISAAIALAAILLMRGLRLYAQTRSAFELGMGLAFGGVGLVLSLYLRYVWHK
jgi:hypothetical protein